MVGCGEDGTGAATDDASLADAAGNDAASGLDTAGGVSDSGTTSSGLGRACAHTADCPDGLQCIATNIATGDGICSNTCTSNADCTHGGYCNPMGKLLICTHEAWCQPCATDADCDSATPLCVPGKDGKSLCSAPCTLGDTTCRAGWSCEQYAGTIDSFACRPDYGSCSGGGEFCAPCQTNADCKAGTTCTTSPDTGERACFQACATTAACPAGFVCSPKGMCAREIPAADKTPVTYIQTCGKSGRIYCDTCDADWQCASGKCATVNDQAFCAEPTECVKANETKDCAEGTFCVPSNKGQVCAPPASWKCQGFKACLGKAAPCGSNEVCDNGLCKPK